MLTAHGTITIRPKEVVPIYREEWSSTVTDYKYNLVNRDFVSRNGILYSVKKQEPGQFVPVGIDPDSEVGVEYWLPFNNLAPTATNFLVVTDDEGMPQTLMSGGRIQTKFLNIGSLNMSETRLWGGAELFTGKGLALVNDPGDRKFVVYNDADNYVEMFQRETEWGLKGVFNGNVDNPVFSLGKKYTYNNGSRLWEWKDNNKIGGFEITNSRIGSIFGNNMENGMSLYDFVVKFKTESTNDSRFAALGSQVYPSSTAQMTLLRLEAKRSGSLTNTMAVFSCDGADGGMSSRNIALLIEKGDLDVNEGYINANYGLRCKHFNFSNPYKFSGTMTLGNYSKISSMFLMTGSGCKLYLPSYMLEADWGHTIFISSGNIGGYVYYRNYTTSQVSFQLAKHEGVIMTYVDDTDGWCVVAGKR